MSKLDMAKKQSEAQAIVDMLSAGTGDDRSKTSLYLSKRVYKDFRKACGKASPSKVIEELMKRFTEDAG